MQFDARTFDEVTSKLEAILGMLGAKNEGVNFNSDNTFVSKAKRIIQETTCKYSAINSVDEQSLTRLFRYFERAISDTQAFLKLVNGKMIIERIEPGRVILQEKKDTYNESDGRYQIDVRL